MLPHLPTISEAVPVAVPAPPKFRAPLGRIRDVNMEETPHEHYAAAKGTSSAQKAGLSYESRVQRQLMQIFGPNYKPSPSIYFSDDRGRRCCIPDGIILGPSLSVVVEIKSQHMPEAWWQLRKLYEPVLRTVYPHVALLEICKSYDAQMPFPEAVRLLGSSPLDLNDGEFGVVAWKI